MKCILIELEKQRLFDATRNTSTNSDYFKRKRLGYFEQNMPRIGTKDRVYAYCPTFDKKFVSIQT